MMSSVFDFPSGELDLGTGLVLRPGRTSVSDLVAAGRASLDSRNGWETFSVKEGGTRLRCRPDFAKEGL